MKTKLFDNLYKVALFLKKWLSLIFLIFTGLTVLPYERRSGKAVEGFYMLKSTIEWADKHIAFLVILGAFIGFCDWLATAIGSPKSRQGMENCLNALQKRIFDPESDTPPDLHRVTLFQRKKWVFPWCYNWEFKQVGYIGIRWPWSGWLVAVARSGHAPGKSKTVLFAPDGGLGVEGVAGHTWRCGNCVWIQNLPTVKKGSATAIIQQYADLTYSTFHWVKRRSEKAEGGVELAHSLCGIPVEVDSKHWGVLVIDSKNSILMDKNEIQKEYSMLTKLIEGFLGGNT